MHRCLVILALTGMAPLACNRTPLSVQDAAAIDGAADVVLVSGQIIVLKEGTGRGLVTSLPGGITCGGTCVADFPGPALVTLTAVPDATSVFDGWSGECQGTGPCPVNVNATHTVTATFTAKEHRLQVSRVGAGRGRVTSLPVSIDCSDDCTARFETGLIVVLSAAADGDSIFTGWSGDCHGTAPCILTLDTDRSVAAQFETLKEGLQVAKTGTGSGRVRSSPLGIDCGAVCVAGFPPGSTITLQAWPDATSTFAGWAGLCQGAEVCTFSLSAAGSVTAAFELIQYSLSVDKTGSGSGTVKATPAGIASAHSCAAIYPAGVLVTLEAKPDETSMFTGWSGACSGTGACTVTMDAAKSVSANFEVLRRRLSLVTTGNGLVTSIPSGISCGNVCAADFVTGSYVALQARPQSGSSFAGWSGPCAGSETCTVIMDADRSLTASFR